MANNKGQGISLGFIVIAAIAVLTLVLVISFVTGGLGGFFSRLTAAGEETVGESDITLAKATCQRLCSEAKDITHPDQWDNQRYCTKVYAFDLDQDGNLEKDAGELDVHCWSTPLNIDCSTVLRDFFGHSGSCSGNDNDCGLGLGSTGCVITDFGVAPTPV